MAVYRITHPMADEISVIDHTMAHARLGVSSEIAFFLEGEWVTNPIPPFEEYHDGGYGDTSVYSWVPNEMIDMFLNEWMAVRINR